ncbi:hypothetical protein BerOc1_03359 [Pseudodesulfovibrio hydrargyri]|uniref:Uncharacterized protein n=1 Tax=Pseudodesulfovibrio hydrargyri TaxID=2125990 RepID=A0A1J5MY05_9BACT|nr:hypothetical protein [Pseudodesulfovibrio hydrargyri]OIQ51406.1 hypothetical protein BerOc1_03359 [Pseudodesulfovibrio hydrargyri]
MNDTLLFGAALFVGMATADMFVRAWTGVLRSVALAVLFFRGRISGEVLFIRLNTTIPLILLCGMTLIAVFFLYFRSYGLGRSELEQLGYFLAAVPRTVCYLMGLNRRIEAMFDPRDGM